MPFLTVALLIFSAGPVQAEDLVVGLYTPNLDFADGVARNGYVSKVADALSSGTGDTWSGRAYARRGDFESALKSGELDVVVVDPAWFGARGGTLKAVASLTASGRSARAMYVFVKPGSATSIHQLKGQRIAIPDVPLMDDLLTGDVLGGEVDAGSFFGAVDRVKDVRAARNAVELDKADAFLAWDGYGDGFAALYSTADVPLPVVAIAGKLGSSTESEIRSAVRGMSASGANLVSGASSYSSSDMRRFKAAASRKQRTRRPELMAPADIELSVGRLGNVKSGDGDLRPTRAADAFVLPRVEEAAP